MLACPSNRSDDFIPSVLPIAKSIFTKLVNLRTFDTLQICKPRLINRLRLAFTLRKQSATTTKEKRLFEEKECNLASDNRNEAARNHLARRG
jgi:hypothetical protein